MCACVKLQVDVIARAHAGDGPVVSESSVLSCDVGLSEVDVWIKTWFVHGQKCLDCEACFRLCVFGHEFAHTNGTALLYHVAGNNACGGRWGDAFYDACQYSFSFACLLL